MSTTLDPALTAGLKERIGGAVLTPEDAGYDDARTVHNGLVDRRPALYRAQPDAAGRRRRARARQAPGLDVSVRGGGHNVAGRAVADGGVMIDLVRDEGDEERPERARLLAAGGGVRWGELNDARGRTRVGRHRWRRLHDRDRRVHPRRRPRLAHGESTAWPPTTCSRSSSSPPTARWSVSTPRRTRISSGRSAEAAGTSAWPRRSRTGCTRSRRSWAA